MRNPNRDSCLSNLMAIYMDTNE
ncbi:hypothetical protein OIU74_006319 [Salix koriyanagi]|uniref:Uncharacterized protein n=1 Tax=Salix koriyanagi TaxID=2511006 RepID=A0A9Q0UDT0_9ROSI|nr:hypothetical protein OIU74_006319 [Salix koriyanagi]